MGSSGASGGGALVQISRQVLTVAAANITFSAIPQGYENLVLRMVAASSAAAYTDTLNINFNGDSGTNYLWEEITAIGSTAAAASSGVAVAIRLGSIPGASAGAGVVGAVSATVPGYARTNINKTILSTSGGIEAAAGVQEWASAVGQWSSTAAISSIVVQVGFGNLVAGTVATLYGES